MDKNMTVLVVEDILSARETVIHILRALGFSRFLEAENGAAALEHVSKEIPGLIISDWNMPKMNGISLLQAVRSMEGARHVPFIFLTSKYEMQDIALASEGGASAYLVKPLTIKALSEALAEVFGSTFERDFELLKAEVKTLCASGKCDQADDLLRRFESLHPDNYPRIRLERVHLLMHISQLESAEKEVCAILSSSPLFTKAWETLVNLQSMMGKWEQALGAAERVISISPNNAGNHVLRGTIHLRREDLHEARKSFMTALNIDRKNDQIKQDIWNAYVDLDMVDEVQRDFGAYIFSSLTCDTLNNMAVAYRRKGELARAVEIYRTALAKEPDNPKILYNAAVAYVNRKQLAKAKELLARALGNDPGFEKARVLYEQVNKAHTRETD
ncbi:Regulator of RpoS [anaerobic digester metagenome]